MDTPPANFLNEVFGGMLGDLFGQDVLNRHAVPREHKEKRVEKVETAWVPFSPSISKKILNMYVDGVAVWDIASLLGVGPDEVNQTIDHYAPHL